MAASPKPQSSLKARALRCLAQREQSRFELRRKLLPHAAAQFETPVAHGNTVPPGAAEASLEPPAAPSPEATVDALLDWLEAHRYLSQERFVEARVHARSGRFGNVRIRQELRQHCLGLSPEAATVLAESELQRAQAAHARKFAAAPPQSALECARQARFLVSRGFSAEVIQRVLKGRRRCDETD